MLIVDDDEDIRRAIRHIVRQSCEVIEEASHGKEAVEKSLRLRPDIVLLDISLPEVNGFQAARQIKRQAPGVRIIFVTQNTDKAYQDAAAEVGADGFVCKGAAARDLPAILQRVMQPS